MSMARIGKPCPWNKRKCPEDRKKRLSEQTKGKSYEEIYGVKRAVLEKEKRSDSHFGIKRSAESRLKQGLSRRLRFGKELLKRGPLR